MHRRLGGAIESPAALLVVAGVLMVFGFGFALLSFTPSAWAGNCDDGLDNDGDGFTDYPDDPGCADPASTLENPQCDDNHDNDGDGLLDWDGAGVGSPDPECIGESFGKSELVASSGGCTSADADADGVIDCEDNCSVRVNPTQFDADGDLCGNVCDADYSQSGVVGFGDFGRFTVHFGSNDSLYEHAEPPSGIVGFADWGIFTTLFGTRPGPSGTTPGKLACP